SAHAENGPGRLALKSISYAGTGCPAGSISGRFPNGINDFELDLDGFVAEAGPGGPFVPRRQKFPIPASFDMPGGWSLCIARVSQRGFVDVDPGVTATQQSTYSFQGDMHQAALRSTATGPAYGAYSITDTLGIAAQVWSPCGVSRALNINA